MRSPIVRELTSGCGTFTYPGAVAFQEDDMSDRNERDEAYFHDRSATWPDLAVGLTLAVTVVLITFSMISVEF